jgi:16S rRNA (adenine1518-N6/adenine1519-N6)-dimethyltransferase
VYLHKLYPVLQGNIIEGDVLKVDKPFAKSFTIVGNFPYNISTEIVFRILEWQDAVPLVIGMFQKEVADRFAAAHGSKTYGITSVLAQCFYDIDILFEVPPTAFTPPPKVMSSVLRMTHRGNRYNIKDFKRFSTFVKTAFSMRRKTLRNCFKSIIAPELLGEEIFAKRAEQLSVADFVALYERTFAV